MVFTANDPSTGHIVYRLEPADDAYPRFAELTEGFRIVRRENSQFMVQNASNGQEVPPEAALLHGWMTLLHDVQQPLFDQLQRVELRNLVWSEMMMIIAIHWDGDVENFRLESDEQGLWLIAPNGTELARIQQPNWFRPVTRTRSRELARELRLQAESKR